MKKLLIFILMVTCVTHVYSQDVIVKKDGSTIISKVLEINDDNIKYKKFSNLNGPTYSINRTEVMSINFENGEKDDFEGHNPIVLTGLVDKLGDSRNEELLELYNRSYQPTDKVKRNSSSANNYLIIFGITSKSILSNDDIEMNLVKVSKSDRYKIKLTNKTKQTIYIDRKNSFKIYNNGNYRSFYNGEIVTSVSVNIKSRKKGLGERFGIGGFVGDVLNEASKEEAKTNTIVKTTMQHQTIAIPPQGTQYLAMQEMEDNELRDVYEPFEFYNFDVTDKSLEKYYLESSKYLGIRQGLTNKGGILTYTEEQSPWAFGYLIKYSTDENFTTYSTITAELFIHQLIGCQNIIWNSENREKYIEGFDNYTILGYN